MGMLEMNITNVYLKINLIILYNIYIYIILIIIKRV